MLKSEVIDRYMHYIMQKFKKMHRFAYFTLADPIIGHCVELNFFEGKYINFLNLKFFKRIAFWKTEVFPVNVNS